MLLDASGRGLNVCIYRLPGVFGKWSRPNYNTVVATFCHRIAPRARDHHLRPRARTHAGLRRRGGSALFIAPRRRPSTAEPWGTLNQVVSRVTRPACRSDPRDASHSCLGCDARPVGRLTRHLYSTYLSFLPQDEFGYPADMRRMTAVGSSSWSNRFVRTDICFDDAPRSHPWQSLSRLEGGEVLRRAWPWCDSFSSRRLQRSD